MVSANAPLEYPVSKFLLIHRWFARGRDETRTSVTAKDSTGGSIKDAPARVDDFGVGAREFKFVGPNRADQAVDDERPCRSRSTSACMCATWLPCQ